MKFRALACDYDGTLAHDGVVSESTSNYPKIVENLPERMTYLDLARPLPEGGFEERRGRIIVAGCPG